MATPPLIQDLSIALAVPNHNPALLTPDFLVGTGIVPADWELAIPPIVNSQGSRIVFQNDITFVAQPGSINFAQAIEADTTAPITIAEIAYKYAKTLTNLEYQAVSIQPKCFLPFETQPDGARKYITNTLLAEGPWKQPLSKPMRASLKLIYPLKDSELRVTITEAQLKRPNHEPVMTVMFAGTFAYTLDEETPEARLGQLKTILDNCQSDFETFQKLVTTKFQIDSATNGRSQARSATPTTQTLHK
ncbi:hypothetical protein PN498_08730 [Oscillatoria sp. CS-180]|uniref:hypothetical protein n=1 Tax=Oscillatoria sp. CS-180 TaxID=3021720 RepID=UPI00232DD3BD|nr:hypothetical protein [Oscillatoria sp. CS-180]MDB9526069.1 hypothetical protein [Oscillatoria sp. CS-180]